MMEKFKEEVYKFDYPKEMLDEFIDYWTEKNMNGRKMRYEKEKTFGLSRRLKTWARNNKKWNPQKKNLDAGEILKQRYGLS